MTDFGTKLKAAKIGKLGIMAVDGPKNGDLVIPKQKNWTVDYTAECVTTPFP